MSAIGPGDYVECVDAKSPHGQLADGGFLVEGHTYCVESLSRAQTDDALVVSVRLVGQPDRHAKSGRRGSYGIWRFRPIYRPKAELIQSLLAPAPAVPAAPATPAQPERVQA